MPTDSLSLFVVADAFLFMRCCCPPPHCLRSSPSSYFLTRRAGSRGEGGGEEEDTDCEGATMRRTGVSSSTMSSMVRTGVKRSRLQTERRM